MTDRILLCGAPKKNFSKDLGVTEPCSLPLKTGEGDFELPRWYADPNDKSCSRQCKQFMYKGAKGNQNNFLTKAACEKKCQRKCKSPCGTGTMLMTPKNEPRFCSPTSPCPQTHWCHVGISAETTVCCSTVLNTCELPMMKGHGNSYLTRWHFDNNQKKCVKFIYSGEGGNQVCAI
uniref:BPTI/Kunitz inhibitor domain-containing protein n=1 Tax=Angiostrongylus cantonensis TaxID=6313 RepID=A0A0K0D8Y7_ANGCA